MPSDSTLTEITIVPKHARLQKFLAGKGLTTTTGDEPVKVEVSAVELTALLRKAKEHGFEDLIKAPKTAVKKAEKAQKEVAETGTIEPRDPEPSDETTGEQADEESEEESSAPKRRRRA